MTPDGISDDDWDVTLDLAARIVNATSGDSDHGLYNRLNRQMSKHLDTLEEKYGPLPSILAMKADYAEDTIERIRLLEKAWEHAEGGAYRANKTLIASSLAETYIDELGNVDKGKDWLSRLEKALGDHWDDDEHKEFQRLVEAIKLLEQ